MRVLLLGGTGAMGMHLSEILAERGHSVFVTSRKSRESSHNVTYIQGNAHDISFLESVLNDKWDVVIDFMIYKTAEFSSRVSLLLNSSIQYVYLSSARVYADSATAITENSPRLLDVCQDKKYLATDEYALTKARQENILFNSGCKNWTIIRPYITFSEIRLQLGVMEKELWLARHLRNSPIVFSKDIANCETTLTYGYDVAQGIAAICGNPQAFGEAFHITGDKSFKWQTVFEHYLKVLEKVQGHPVKTIMLEKAIQLKGPGYYQVVYDRYFNRKFDNSKIAQFMQDYTFHDPLPELEKCLETFLRKPEFKYFEVRYGAKYDRICKTSIPLFSIPGWKNRIKYFLFRYILPL